MKSELRRNFYRRLQMEFDTLRGFGVDRAIIIELLSERYCITKTSIRANIDTETKEAEAREHARELLKQNT